MAITEMDALRRAYEILGSQAGLARAIGIKQPSVQRVLKRGNRVPADWCIKIERATRGEITRQQLRPDLYPDDEPSPCHFEARP